MRISDWSSDVCSSDLSLEFVDGVLAWRLVSLDCLHACEADACDQANAVVTSPASALLVALLSLRVAVVLDESKMRRGAGRAVLPSVVADRKSVVWGKSVSLRVDLGGRGAVKKKKRIIISLG